MGDLISDTLIKKSMTSPISAKWAYCYCQASNCDKIDFKKPISSRGQV